MHPESAPVGAATQRLRDLLGDAPPLAMVLGSGLGPLVDRLEVQASAGYDELELPQSTVAGHAGRAYRGLFGGAPVVVLSGRVHYYEGYSLGELARTVRALEQWGVRRLVLTCSAGGITPGFNPGRVAVVSDHINLQAGNPLMGPAWKGEPRFPDLTAAYSTGMRDVLLDAADELEIELLEGVYAAMNGPGYETPAEIRMLRSAGADLVGMSTVPELLAAVQAGLEVAVLSVVSNRAAGLAGSLLDHADVTEVAGRATKTVADVLERAAQRLVAL